MDRTLAQSTQEQGGEAQPAEERQDEASEKSRDQVAGLDCGRAETMDLKFNNSRKYVSISVPSKTQAMSPHIKSVEDVVVLGVNLSKFSKLTQFLICVAGVFVFYLIYGYLQELIFSVEGFKPYGWYLTLVQFAFYSVFGLIELQLTQDRRRSPVSPSVSFFSVYEYRWSSLSGTPWFITFIPRKAVQPCRCVCRSVHEPGPDLVYPR
ncbi:adenosine 3'-phospho 5'-phosphosulfate transporter 2 isoform X5 [Mus musculus]|uniref:adenosine 3'-phospho 5'-phosphosulfate transporter 2 isoform X5 n=1 Tax=Mus musculus TaxID=10090 RepID=UPI0011AE4399|nr:adenosine 3'-phospho 5'-phosphosulfate transporter 2 isoform X5 [Mus musculus]